MAKTFRERFVAALLARGEKRVKETHKYEVFTRNEGGYFYVGRSGSLRFGHTSVGSIPCSNKFKNLLLNGVDRSFGCNQARS